jgi:hypothetical protein
MFCSRYGRVCPSSVFVAAYAAWLCGEFSTAKHAGMSGAGDAIVLRSIRGHHQRHDVFPDCRTISPDLLCLGTKRGREWVGSVYPRPPLLSSIF